MRNVALSCSLFSWVSLLRIVCHLSVTDGQKKDCGSKFQIGDRCVDCHCLDKTACERIYENEPCVSGGCDPGYKGDFCLERCDKENTGHFGAGCRSLCHCTSTGTGSCHHITGICSAGCNLRYTGHACQYTCIDQNKYDFIGGCNKNCHCKKGATCNVVNGNCNDQNCADGWEGRGEGCQKACSESRYGAGCYERCNCGKGAECHHITGVCSTCTARRTGATCDDKCPQNPFTYNHPACDKTCHCLNNLNCNVTNGECIGGNCAAGYHGKGCQLECPDGKWGSDCTEICHCRDDKPCVKETGRCDHCHIRWDLDSNCQTTCPEGMWGVKCDKKCHCSNPAHCPVANGYCEPAGCTDGYTGDDCQAECIEGRFGHDCDYYCNCKDENEVCNFSTGACPISGCKGGNTAVNCSIGCAGRWGPACAKDCHCLYNRQCDGTTGRCDACDYRFDGPACQGTCPHNKYHGKNGRCTETCSCVNSASCKIKDGDCQAPCTSARQSGNNCEKPCKDIHSFLIDGKCTGRCHCQADYQCRVTNGECVGGKCEPGYSGKDCQIGCGIGKFGKKCSKICKCKDKQPCDKAGRCPDGECAENYSGIHCQNYEDLSGFVVKTGLWIASVFGLVVIASLILFVLNKKRMTKRRLEREERATAAAEQAAQMQTGLSNLPSRMSAGSTSKTPSRSPSIARSKNKV